ncbi:MAG TPA: nuclear transport factor 2 family protein [Bryobacteraceae bacterium]|nr:nuclear transport factor 2 family protein [Bryobacteraceae bacterium]
MRFSKATLLAGSLALLVASATVLSAESINPPTTPQTAPMTAKEKKNLETALNWWREVIQARHVELAPKYQAENYIQHNPNINTGRDAFVKIFGSRPPVNPIPEKMANPPVVMGAKGDFVWLIWEREQKDPRNPDNTYHFNTFDVIRFENGKVQEHWDSAQRTPMSPVVEYGVSPKPPMQWNTGKLSGEEKKTLAMATEELKDMLQYGHLELADKTMDPGYIQHNPNVPQGRDGFKAFMSRVPGRTPEEIKPEWKNEPVLTLINGPYSLMMWDRKVPDPADPSKMYVWNHYDVVRTEGGKIKEHWDEAVINPPGAGGKKQ